MRKYFTFLTFLTIVSFMTNSALATDKTTDKIVIAHRGASGYLPEHTLAAKALAHGMNADYLEQDVVLTKDGVPVVLHDHYLDTVTDVAKQFPDRKRDDGRYYAIDFTLAEIKSLVAFERISLKTGKQVFPNRFPSGTSTFRVPTLDEELEFIAGLNKSTGKSIGIYPEIKAPAFHRAEGQDISKIVLETLAKHGYATKDDPFYLQCFDWNENQRIRNTLGFKGKLIQLIAPNSWGESPNVDFDYLRTAEGLAEVAKIAEGIGPWIPHIINKSGVQGSLVKRAHKVGLDVHPYTLRADALPAWAESYDDVMQRIVIEAGADGIFTDHTDLAVKFLANKSQ
ncbi:MAG: glycerophosphodiester phosphodiesterase [Hyphomicrobiales bacterium]